MYNFFCIAQLISLKYESIFVTVLHNKCKLNGFDPHINAKKQILLISVHFLYKKVLLLLGNLLLFVVNAVLCYISWEPAPATSRMPNRHAV